MMLLGKFGTIWLIGFREDQNVKSKRMDDDGRFMVAKSSHIPFGSGELTIVEESVKSNSKEVTRIYKSRPSCMICETIKTKVKCCKNQCFDKYSDIINQS